MVADLVHGSQFRHPWRTTKPNRLYPPRDLTQRDLGAYPGAEQKQKKKTLRNLWKANVNTSVSSRWRHTRQQNVRRKQVINACCPGVPLDITRYTRAGE